MSEVIGLYRKLLKEINTYIPSKSQHYWRNKLATQFRTKTIASTHEGSELLYLLKGLTGHKDLLTRYNVGAFIDEKERIRKTTARVGLQLPKVYTDGNERN